MKISIKNTFFTISIIVSTLFGVNSCAPVYIPNVVNLPVFSEQGEFQGAVYASGLGADAQIAYAATDHLGLMLNGRFESYKSDFGEEFREQSFLEFGVGYFEKVQEKWIVEFYGGAGMGSVQGLYNGLLTPGEAFDASSYRIFVQPSIGILGDPIDVSIANRIAFVKIDQNTEGGSALFMEPVVTTRFGFKNLKMVVQAGLSYPLAQELINFEHQPFLLSFGIHGRLNRRQ